MFNDEGVVETEPRDAGLAPSAPASGPLVNISHTPEMVHPEGGQQMSTEGDRTANEISPQQTLFVTKQPETAATQAVDDIPVFDAGRARVDLMTR